MGYKVKLWATIVIPAKAGIYTDNLDPKDRKLCLLLNQNTSQLCCGDEWFDKNLSRLRDTPLLAAGRGSFVWIP